MLLLLLKCPQLKLEDLVLVGEEEEEEEEEEEGKNTPRG